MAFLDSSVIVEYLDDTGPVVEYVDEQPHLLTSSICVYEVLQGEVLSRGPSDIVGARQTFGRIEAIEFNETIALEAARLQDQLATDGETMPARDLMIAASARSTGDELVVADSDFRTDTLADYMSVTTLRG